MKTERAESVAGLVRWNRVARAWPDADMRRGDVYRATILGSSLHAYDSSGHASLVPLIMDSARNIADVDPWGWK